MKNTLLTDLVNIYVSLECNRNIFSCHKCSNRALCDLLEKLINSIEEYY